MLNNLQSIDVCIGKNPDPKWKFKHEEIVFRRGNFMFINLKFYKIKDISIKKFLIRKYFMEKDRYVVFNV